MRPAAPGTVASGVLAASGNQGELWSWGNNIAGQLGDGTTTQRNSPVQIGSDTDWEYVSAGGSGDDSSYALAIKSGKLYAWGRNRNGTLGDGTSTQRYSPVQIGSDTDWEYVSAGCDADRIIHSLGIKGGKLYAWGSNTRGQLGDGTTTARTSPVQIGSDTDWECVTAYVERSFGIRDGKLYGWGVGTNTPAQVGSNTDWEYVTSKGEEGEGELCVGVRAGKIYNLPDLTQVESDTDWGQVAVGFEHYLAIKTNGKLYARGSNTRGQLGDGTTTTRTTFTQIGSDTDWENIVAGDVHSLGIKDGKLYAWGGNTSGQLGDGTTTQRNSPVQIGSVNHWKLTAAAHVHSHGIQ